MNDQNVENSKSKSRKMHKCSTATSDNRPNFLLPRHRAVSLCEESKVDNFYSNGTILITGGTGFIGKTLIEKLIRTCKDLSRIYILIRPKREQAVEERCQDLFNSSVSNTDYQ